MAKTMNEGKVATELLDLLSSNKEKEAIAAIAAPVAAVAAAKDAEAAAAAAAAVKSAKEKVAVSASDEAKEKAKAALDNLRPGFIKQFDEKTSIYKKRIFLRGYVGNAYQYLNDKPTDPDPDRMRVYLSPELNSYIEFEVQDYLWSEKIDYNNANSGSNIWLRAKRPKKDDPRKDNPVEVAKMKEEEMEDIELTYGGQGYELSRTKHYLDGDMLAGFGDNAGAGMTPMGCGTTPTPTCPSRCAPGTGNCAPTPTPTCPNTRCQMMGGGGNGGTLPTGMLCDKYATMVGCDEWDFRKNYRPY